MGAPPVPGVGDGLARDRCDPILNQSPIPAVVAMQTEAARRLGMTVRILDADFGYLFELRRGGRRATMLGGRSPLNDAVAARICEDKFYTQMVLADAGHRVPATERCLAPGHFQNPSLDAAAGIQPGLTFARANDYPLVVKPNRLSHGRDVVMVHDERQMIAAVERVWQSDYIALVQERIDGTDMRLDFLDGTYLAGYIRRPVVLHGDGIRTIRELVTAHDPRFGRDSFQQRRADDPRWRREVLDRGLDAESVLPDGERIDLGGDILNLNGWAAAELISELPDAWRDHCRAIGDALNLRHFGIDLRSPGLGAPPQSATIIEVNASPLLLQLYNLGHRQTALAAQARVLDAILPYADQIPDA